MIATLALVLVLCGLFAICVACSRKSDDADNEWEEQQALNEQQAELIRRHHAEKAASAVILGEDKK